MPFSATLPAVDANLWNQWSQEDKDKYAKMPYFLVKDDQEMRKRYTTHTQLITQTVPWKPNEGELMKQVIVEDSPIIRQEARPNSLQEVPLADIHTVRERYVEARLYSHEFYSPHFQFLPSFQDFMRGNLLPCRRTLETQIRFYEEFFYRTYIWDYSPYVYFVGRSGGELVPAPVGSGAKTSAWIAAQLSKVSGGGKLSFKELYKAFNVATEELSMTPYEGSTQPGGDSKPLDERYCFVTSSRQWNSWLNDSWLKENRPLNMNIVTDSFKGDIFGRIRCKIEKYPMRFAVDDDFGVTLPAPESYNVTSTDGDYNRTRMSDAYSKIANAPVEVGWLYGGRNYRKISVGAPPDFFSGSASDPSKIAGLTWNGQLNATRNFLIPKKNANDEIIWDTNNFGEYVRFQAKLALGIIATHAFNVLPVVYYRQDGIDTVLA